MLCEKCKQRPATVHITEVRSSPGISDVAGKHDYCEACAPKDFSKGTINLSALLEGLQDPEKLRNVLRSVLPKNTRFPPEAFEFIGDAWEEVSNRSEPSHVSAHNLLAGFRELALARFGKGAKKALANWGIHRIEDFVEIFFAMADAGLVGNQLEGKPEDFTNGYNFDEAFPED